MEAMMAALEGSATWRELRDRIVTTLSGTARLIFSTLEQGPRVSDLGGFLLAVPTDFRSYGCRRNGIYLN